MPLLALILFLFALIPQSLRADDNEKRMRDLLTETGSFPEAVLRPPDPVEAKLSLSERLTRLWHRMLGFRVTYATARGKACQANQRVIAGAVEMYNMDKGPMMKNIRHSDVTTSAGVLVSGHYLKNAIQPPEVDCEYRSHGDLTGNGLVYCVRHGTTPELYQAIMKISGLKTPADAQAENLNFAIAGLAILMLVSLVVLLTMFFKRRKPVEKTEG